MTIEVDGLAGRIGKLWGEHLSQRAMRWLWMYLKFFSEGCPTHFSLLPKPAGGRIHITKGQFLGGDIDLELEKLLEWHAASIPSLKLGGICQQLDFGWIDGSDVRQLRWLIEHVHVGLHIEVPEARVRLGERDYFICLIDIVALPDTDKAEYLSNLHRLWTRHLKSTSYLNWFNDEDELDRCAFAWQTLDSRLKSTVSSLFQLKPVVGEEFRKYEAAVGLKSYFDALQVSEYEKKSHVDHVKKLWSQKKYREKLEKNKVRQRNFVLADATIKSLDRLAKELGVSRTEALERLIELAARHGIPDGQ